MQSILQTERYFEEVSKGEQRKDSSNVKELKGNPGTDMKQMIIQDPVPGIDKKDKGTFSTNPNRLD